jgi:hypothetical protein
MCVRHGQAGRFCLRHPLLQHGPPGVDGRGMPMFRACLGEQRPALGAQTRAIRAAQWREREREHERITEDRLKVEQVPD